MIKFKTAATANAGLKNSLKWTFGKKQQTGWDLYIPLIQDTINTESDSDSTEFAFALSVWQQKNSLAPNGKLDAETLSALIKFWQSRRLPKIYEADEKLLFNAPISDFYDPTRDANLLNVERETYNAYKKMCAAAAKDLGLKFENGNLTGTGQFSENNFRASFAGVSGTTQKKRTERRTRATRFYQPAFYGTRFRHICRRRTRDDERRKPPDSG